MSEKQTKLLIATMRKQTKAITSTPGAALKFMQEAGILTSKGEYTAPYKRLRKQSLVN